MAEAIGVAGTNQAHRGALGNSEAVAPAWHTVIMLLLLATPLIQALLSPQGAAAKPSSTMAFYISGQMFFTIFFGWLWIGLRMRRVPLRTLVGGRWSNWRDVAIDLGLGFAFWALWYFAEVVVRAALVALGVNNAHASGMMFPEGKQQITMFVFCSVSAGILEELLFRGYLMRQFTAWTGSALGALALQAMIFGMLHGFYLGTRQVIIIAISGLLIGVFAMWRKSLRAAMIFHSWADIFGAILVRGLPFA